MTFGPIDRARAWWRELPSETRFSATILGGCGIATIILSVFYLKSNISSPFLVPNSTLVAARDTFGKASSAAREAEASKSKDTDRDGLSDYAELKLYRTSPYLSDTDSDGIPDAIEIAQGTDPNCPKGQNCSGIANADLQPSLYSTSSNASLLDVTAVRRISEPGQADVSNTAAEAFIRTAPDPGTINATQARTLLLNSGLVTADTLAGLNEPGIMQVYRATYAQVLQIREGLKNPTANNPQP